jgi:Protein of unknown function (DUF1553)/Protein of unknown function (DUF1549)
MSRVWSARLALAAACLAGLPALLQASDPPPRDPVKDARALAARIDRHIAAKWAANKVKPAPRSSDADFFRRVNLDLLGKIPSIVEARDFTDDDSPDKRWTWVEEMLKKAEGSPEKSLYARHFANVWRHIILPQNNTEVFRFYSGSLENWLFGHLEKNTGYDKMVRELLTASPYGQGGNGASIFYQVNEFKPENLAAVTSRLFLGHKLECAQCHDHPFAKWTRKQFWEYTAFFSGINQNGVDNSRSREIKITGTDKVVKARFLDGTAPKWKEGVSTRATLADWLTRADNPYFARAAVNKVWAYFFGIGLIEPVDEPSAENPPSHPELLDELAREFAAHKFDLKFLIRAIVASRAYQLTSASTDPAHKDPRLFARMLVRGLSPEQLFDSVAVALDIKDPGPTNQFDFNGIPNTPRAQFLGKFANQGKPSETETSILQALFMMNGKFMTEAASLQHNEPLRRIAEAPVPGAKTVEPIYLGPPGSASLLSAHLVLSCGHRYFVTQRLEQIYLVTLSRLPTAKETRWLIPYVLRGGKHKDSKKAYEDLAWALFNSGEFILNH